MKSALEKILEYKVKDGRVTSQSDKEQWTCLQKIIAINKLIVDYHNAFVELKESYQDLLDRYNEINAEWDVLKTDMEAIASEWTQFKPLVQQIINLWENTITPTFEEWTTLMNNWGNTMNGYSDTMADYEQQMMNIQQEFNEIETAWGNITLAVRGNFKLTTYTVKAGGSKYLEYEFDDVNELYVSVIGNTNSTIQFYLGSAWDPIYLTANMTEPLTMLVGMRYLGNFSETNSLYQLIGTNSIRGMFTDFTDTKFRVGIENGAGQTDLTVSIYTRHVPYFSVDQSAEVQEALTKANQALTKANTVDETVVGVQGDVSELQNRAFGQVLHNFSNTAIPTNQTATYTNNSRNAWSHIVLIWNADSGTNPPVSPLYIPVSAIPESGTRQFVATDDKYNIAEIGWSSAALTIKNVSTSTGNSLRYIALF